jgi:NAD+ kinase
MDRGIRKIGFIFKRQDARVPAIARTIVPFLQSRGVEVLLDNAVEDQCLVAAGFMSAGEMVRQVDIIAVFGGDGTLLYAARLIGERNIPILGVNLGTLGFLTEVKPEAMHAAFDCLLSGQYEVQERMFLHIEVLQGGSVLAEYLALNDAVINKGALARIVELEISVDSETALNARSDGLIISSPTGSTAYSMASGGPILYPTIDAFIIAPICPHALSNRPLVIPDTSTVSVCLKHGSDVMLTVDGQIGIPLEPQATLNIRRAKPKMRLVLPFGNNYFRLLREKLLWG